MPGKWPRLGEVPLLLSLSVNLTSVATYHGAD